VGFLGKAGGMDDACLTGSSQHRGRRQAAVADLQREAGLLVVGPAEALAQARRQLDGVDVAVLDLDVPERDGAVDLLRFAGRDQDRRRTELAVLAEITPREREILQLLADGLTNEEIASRLVISRRTQRNHVANILRKLGAHSQLQAVMCALRHDVVHMR
jgi:DNA-binding CsgD family transcriptional regulator